MKIADKVVIVTGGASGIGRAIGEAFLKVGAKVSFFDIVQNDLDTTKSEMRRSYGEDKVICCFADVTDDEQMRAAFHDTKEALGTIDILINNAGIVNESKPDSTISINLGGVVRGTELALEYMDPGNGGVVVSIASVAGLYFTEGLLPLIPIYCSTKAAIVAYTKCFSRSPDVLSRKIRLVCLCPTYTDTPLMRRLISEPGRGRNFVENASEVPPLMKPDDVASIVISLVEDDTNHGQAIAIQAPGMYISV